MYSYSRVTFSLYQFPYHTQPRAQLTLTSSFALRSFYSSAAAGVQLQRVRLGVDPRSHFSWHVLVHNQQPLPFLDHFPHFYCTCCRPLNSSIYFRGGHINWVTPNKTDRRSFDPSHHSSCTLVVRSFVYYGTSISDEPALNLSMWPSLSADSLSVSQQPLVLLLYLWAPYHHRLSLSSRTCTIYYVYRRQSLAHSFARSVYSSRKVLGMAIWKKQ